MTGRALADRNGVFVFRPKSVKLCGFLQMGVKSGKGGKDGKDGGIRAALCAVYMMEGTGGWKFKGKNNKQANSK